MLKVKGKARKMNPAVCLRGVKERRGGKRVLVTEVERKQGEEGALRRKMPSEGSLRSCSQEVLRQS